MVDGGFLKAVSDDVFGEYYSSLSSSLRLFGETCLVWGLPDQISYTTEYQCSPQWLWECNTHIYCRDWGWLWLSFSFRFCLAKSILIATSSLQRRTANPHSCAGLKEPPVGVRCQTAPRRVDRQTELQLCRPVSVTSRSSVQPTDMWTGVSRWGEGEKGGLRKSFSLCCLELSCSVLVSTEQVRPDCLSAALIYHHSRCSMYIL